MAVIFTVEYPGGERALAIGHPHGPLVVRTVPRGPESCYLDVLEATADASWAIGAVVRVRVLGGPRIPGPTTWPGWWQSATTSIRRTWPSTARPSRDALAPARAAA